MHFSWSPVMKELSFSIYCLHKTWFSGKTSKKEFLRGAISMEIYHYNWLGFKPVTQWVYILGKEFFPTRPVNRFGILTLYTLKEYIFDSTNSYKFAKKIRCSKNSAKFSRNNNFIKIDTTLKRFYVWVKIKA